MKVEKSDANNGNNIWGKGRTCFFHFNIGKPR